MKYIDSMTSQERAKFMEEVNELDAVLRALPNPTPHNNTRREQMTREATNKILEMVEEGVLDKDNVILACLKYMSEDEVADMAHINEFFNEGDEE